MADLKFCKDCKHCRPDREWYALLIPFFGWIYWLAWNGTGQHLRFAKCSNQIKNQYGNEMVTGPKYYYFHCTTQRKFDCGRDAIWFEPK